MKSFKIKFVFLAMLVTLFLISCTKTSTKAIYTQKSIKALQFTSSKTSENYNKLSDSNVVINYNVIDGRINFLTEEDFNNFLIEIDEDEITGWISTVGFNSYFNTSQTGRILLDDDKLCATLNNYGIIQVGDYLIKMIPSTQKVLVMSTDNISSLYDLESATAGTNNIQEFSFDDEVFGILEEQGGVSTPTNALARTTVCHDRHAERLRNPYEYNYNLRLDCDDPVKGSDVMAFIAVVRYQKIGISVRLYSAFGNYDKTAASLAWASHSYSGVIEDYYVTEPTKETQFQMQYKYTPRCRSEVTGTLSIVFYDHGSSTYENYRSTRDCKSYYLKTKFSFKDRCLNNFPDVTTLTISN